MSSNNHIIVVGTGRSVLDQKNGSIIDSFNHVYRSARSMMHQGYEEYVGSKTDTIWIKDLYFGDLLSISKFNGNVLIITIDFDHYKECGTTYNCHNAFDYIKSPYHRNFCLQKAINYHNLKNITHISQKNFFKMCVNLNFNNVYTHNFVSSIPTAGITLLYYLVEVERKENICVTGFDFFKTNNYFSPSSHKIIAKRHKIWAEQLYYNNLLKEGKIYELR